MSPILKTSLIEVDQESAAARMAVLELQGVGIQKQVQLLSEEFNFNFTRRQLQTQLSKKESYAKTKEEYTKSVVKAAVADLKRDVSRLVPKIIQALEKALGDGDIKAIPPALKILGIDIQEAVDNKQAQNITVVLPGKRDERSIEGIIDAKKD